jgi:hypothetical protein
MLSAHQCEVVAFETPDGVVCYDCGKAYVDNDVYFEKCMRGLDDWPHRVDPVIRYTFDEQYGTCHECGHDRDVECDDCGVPIV